MRKRVIVVFLAVCALGFALWGIDVLADRRYRVAIVAPAALYSLPPHEYPESNPVVAVLPPGQSVRVLRVRYGKDFEALRVETLDGQVGWLLGGEGVKVLSRGGALAG